jgi:teichoic acid transport system permease protein
VRDDGRLSAPGELRQGDQVSSEGITTTQPPGQPLAELAAQYGLKPSAATPPVFSYLRQLWIRRHFIAAFATARNIAMYTEARLGQLWQVLTPLLNVAVYYLIFGLLLHTNKGIPDYISFLVVGVFVFNFTQRAFISTSRVMLDGLPLIRALQFPRASLPIAYVMIELEQMFVSMAVLIVIILARGEPVTWYWLLAIPVLFLLTVFNVGIGLFAARLGAQVNDFSQLLPFLMRTWMYLSGVLFSIQALYEHHDIGTKTALLLQLNPAALYITLMRNALLQTQRQSAPGSKPYDQARCGQWVRYVPYHSPPSHLYDSAYCHPIGNPAYYWYFAIGWAVLALVIGFFYFWRAEVRYGRG